MNARYAYHTAAESEHSGSGTYSSACLKSTDCFGTCDTHFGLHYEGLQVLQYS